MKFSAEFDSVNSADIAAAAIKKQISSFSDMKVSEKLMHKPRASHSGMIIFNSFNPVTPAQAYTPPVSIDGLFYNMYEYDRETDLRSHPTLEITCREDDAAAVSRMLIGYGGRNIHKS